MPPNQAPSKDVVTAYVNDLDRHDSMVSWFNPSTDEEKPKTQWMILAPTADRAEELMREYVRLVDEMHVYYPARPVLEEMNEWENTLVEVRASLKSHEKEYETLQKEMEGLERYKDINQATLDSFVTQQRLISVELIGINARIGACEKILANRKPGDSTARIDQVESAKIAAEIELVGVAARKEAIEQIVTKGKQRQVLSEKRAQALLKVRSDEAGIKTFENRVKRYTDEIEEFTPPTIEGPIVIHPIRWEAPSAKRGG